MTERPRPEASATRTTSDSSGSQSRHLVYAVLSAAGVFGVGLLLLAMPGLLVLEIARGLGFARNLAPDSVWPLGILINFVGAVLVVPMSMAMRMKRPDIVGWRHAGFTALLTFAATLIFAIIVSR
jgi:hypothetical protein